MECVRTALSTKDNQLVGEMEQCMEHAHMEILPKKFIGNQIPENPTEKHPKSKKNHMRLGRLPPSPKKAMETIY